MPKTKKVSKISGMGILFMLASTAAAVFFCWQLYGNMTEIDAKLVGDYMKESATSMQKLKSYSGNSVAEAYYNDHGEYLEGESKIYNAQIWFQKRTAMAVDVIGLLACLVLFVYGMRQKTTVSVEASRSTSTPSHKETKQDEDGI